MSTRIKVNQLADEVHKAVTEYEEDIEDAVIKNASETARQALAELKIVSPRDNTTNKRGYHYADGWTISTRNVTKEGYFSKKIWNPKDYRLTHLLEFGHTDRAGGHVNAQPHIRDVEKKYRVQFTENLERDIKK